MYPGETTLTKNSWTSALLSLQDMEVLVEIGGSRKAILFSREAIVDLLLKEDAKGYFVLDDKEKRRNLLHLHFATLV